MKNVKWGEYKLDDLFEIVGTKSLDSNAIDFTKTGVNFVGRTFENNGIQGKIQKRDFEPNKPFTITATVIGNYKYVKFQTEPYYCSQNINKLTPKSIIKKWNERIAYFFIASVQKFVSLYDGQQGGYKLSDIKNHTITVPTKNGEIDFDFMERFVAEIEREHILKLENYLNKTGLSDYHLTKSEQKILEDFEKDSFNWGEFRIGDLFEIGTGSLLSSNELIYGNIPRISAKSYNNGILDYYDTLENSNARHFENFISVNFFGTDGGIFYHPYKASVEMKVHTLTIPNHTYNSYTGVFIAGALKQNLKGFDYGSQLSSSKLKKLDFKIQLPITKNGEIDYAFMETLISATQKLVIKDLVLYVDRKSK